MKWILAAPLFAMACGDNTGAEQVAPPDAGPPPWTEAVHGTAPTLVGLGGPVLAAPKIQPIFFANDDAMQTKIDDFLAQLATSSYWTTTTSEYGVGAVGGLPAIISTDTPPTSDAALTAWLSARLDGTHTADGWPATVDPQTIYSVFTPQGVVIHSDFGDSCSAYGAYHDELTGTHGESIVYALMPRCAGLDDLTVAFSHELVEAATDPRVETDPAFGDADPDNYVMAITPGAETGDYCEYLPSAAQRLVGTYAVQRTWSNAASLAGKDPCVPAPATPYLAGVPMFTEAATIDGFSGPVTTKGISLAAHTTKTVSIQVISDVPTEAFELRALDASAMTGGPAELAFTWDKANGKNGDVLNLQITRTRDGQLPGSEFVVEGRSGGHTVSMWWGYAGN